MSLYCVICFFNQKTAYEMRISDWSSDVCSSDLGGVPAGAVGLLEPTGLALGHHAGEQAAAGAQQRGKLLQHIAGLGVGEVDERGCSPDPVEGAGRVERADAPPVGPGDRGVRLGPIGRAAGRERVGQYVSISVVGGS